VTFSHTKTSKVICWGNNCRHGFSWHARSSCRRVWLSHTLTLPYWPNGVKGPIVSNVALLHTALDKKALMIQGLVQGLLSESDEGQGGQITILEQRFVSVLRQ